jgi:hypothetical protein
LYIPNKFDNHIFLTNLAAQGTKKNPTPSLKRRRGEKKKINALI